jgi:hypothetical protein
MTLIAAPSEATIVLPLTKAYAKANKSDLAIPACRGSGLGNAIVYTRLVEEWARSRGRPAIIITAPLQPKVGRVLEEDSFAIWRNNPFIATILNAEEIDPEGYAAVDEERRSLIQLNHVIENICFAYGLRPRRLQASLFLSHGEMQWAMKETSHLSRPLVCLHPGGNTQSLPGTPWHGTMWHALVERMSKEASFFQVGRTEFGDQDLGLDNPGCTIREAMALIWASDAFVGFDSGPMTIATAFEKPTITLFDMSRKCEAEACYGSTHVPSVMLRWAYPQNRNIALMENDNGAAALAAVVDALREKLFSLTYRV